MTKNYYQRHREIILDKTRQRHEQDSEFKTYRQLILIRKQLYNYKESIRVFRVKIGRLKVKIKDKIYNKEALELQWLAERRQREKDSERTA